MKSLLLSFVVLCLAVSSSFSASPFQLCDGKPTDAKVTDVVVPNCDGAGPCEIKKGTNVSVAITFSTGMILCFCVSAS